MRVPTAEFVKAREQVAAADSIEVYGRVQKVVGLVIESSGPSVRIGDMCLVNAAAVDRPIRAEVVGFRGNRILLMPFAEMTGVRAGCTVRSTGGCHRVPVGDALLGRVLTGLGEPLDGRPPLPGGETYPVLNRPPNPMKRQRITRPLPLGVRALDALLTCGVGQRLGIFSGSGVGKSTLLGMVARHTEADVNVIALVGERGREVREFIERDLGKEGLERSVVVVATSDQPALVRIKAAFTATAIAESFRDRGMDVLFMMDSITRFAMAQREVGLAIGEPPSTKGYTPSVFSLLPRLMERAGMSDVGSITALYSVLVEGDDTNEPIADTARSILDGHIVLERKLANAGHYPAIDVLASLSRVMPEITPPEQMKAANRLRELISAYREVEDLVSIGAYKSGSKPVADAAIERWDRITAFLRQDKTSRVTLNEAVAGLLEIVNA
ncbi:MAG: flagellar protein export ATPase FliI [Armatimonadetes bacterium]|nr:flagellar protein export ATPase FliI [Armatimonadota bacterium]